MVCPPLRFFPRSKEARYTQFTHSLLLWVLTHVDSTLCNIVYSTVILHLVVTPHLTVCRRRRAQLGPREVAFLYSSPLAIDVDNTRPFTCVIAQLNGRESLQNGRQAFPLALRLQSEA